MATLELSTLREASQWIDDDEAMADPRFARCFNSARELVTRDTNPNTVGEAPYPEPLHLAVNLKTAQLYGRRVSTYGVEALGLGGEAGGFISFDPHYRELIRPWRAVLFGAADKTPRDALLQTGTQS